MALNDLGEEIFAKPVTLPVCRLPPFDDAAERKAHAEKICERRVIRAGRDAWEEIGKAGSFSAWCKIGAALAIGRDYALRLSGANAPMGRCYSWTFSAWCKRHGFGTVRPATRSWCLALHENLAAITAWRDALPAGRGRRPPINPQSCVKGWQRSQAQSNGRAPQDWKRDAVAAWQRFLVCVAALPESEAKAMWAMVNNQTMAAVNAQAA
jgi:hypothetical protein